MIDPRALLKNRSQAVKHMRQGLFAFGWISAPIRGRHVHPDKYNAACSEVASLISAALEAERPIVLIGAFGSFWGNNDIHSLSSKIAKRHHRLCHFGIKINPNSIFPSSACIVTLSAKVPINNHSCRCEIQEHDMDWLTEKQALRRQKAFDAIASQVFSECSPVLAIKGASQIMKEIRSKETYTSVSTSTQQETPDYVKVHHHSESPSLVLRTIKKDVSFSSCQPAESSTAALPCVSMVTRTVVDHADLTEDASAFPTEERLQQKAKAKARKEKGIQPKKRPKIIEDHYDDCGTDLSGLGIDPDNFDDNSNTCLAYSIMNSSCHDTIIDLNTFIAKTSSHPSSLDLIEICGGTARTSTIAARKGLTAGENFDLMCSCDLNVKENQHKVLEYIHKTKPLVTVMAPCTPYGPMPNLVKHVAPHAWEASLRQARPHGKFCGQVALEVDQLGLYYLVEQPFPSKLWEETEWKLVFKHQSNKSLLIHQCAAGQKGPLGGPAKKPTTFVSNSETLLSPLTQFVCPGNHEHELLEGEKAKWCQVWPWKLASAIVDGIISLKSESLKSKSLSEECPWPCSSDSFVNLQSRKGQFSSSMNDLPKAYFPSVGTGPSDPDAHTKDIYQKCPGCRGHMSRHDARHTRVRGQCRWPDAEEIIWNCAGCKRDRPAAHESHTNGPDCKHAIIQHRRGTPRTGHHPRQPAERSLDVPGREAQAQLPDGSDLVPVEPPTSAIEAMPQAGEPLPSSSEPRQGRGPDVVERVRRTFQDAAVGDPAPSDWTRYDVRHCLRALRSQHEPTVLLTLRKLHLRLWHAGVSNMQSILRNAGVAQSVLDHVPNVIATCKECRKWAARPRETQPAVEIAMTFGEVVETDLLYYKEYIIHHFVCRASRWHAAIETPSRTESQLLENISIAWVSIFGPMQTLVSDPEAGLNTETADAHLKRQGVTLKIRGKDQHARYIERRGAILRQALHVMDTQAVREGIDLPFRELLAQCVFSGNALVHVGGATPYQVVFGRQPSMLPPITDSPGMNDRREARIREIALQSMISATSATRITRALKVPTTLSAEDRFKPDDLVELYRIPSNKDTSGWRGPYRVVESRAHDGVIVVSINGIQRPYRIQDVRHACFTQTLFGTSSYVSSQSALNLIHAFLDQLSPGRTEVFGLVEDSQDNLVITHASKKWPRIAHALNHLIRTSFQMFDVCSARVGRQVHKLPGQSGPQFNVIFNWDTLNPDRMSTFVSESAKLNVSQTFGPQEPHFAIMQCFCLDQSHGISMEEIVDNLPLREPVGQDRHAQAPSLSDNRSARLSTIPEEGTNSNSVSAEAEILFLQHFADADKEDVRILLELCEIAVNEDSSTFDIQSYSRNEEPIYFTEVDHDNFEFETYLTLKDKQHPCTLQHDSSGPFLELEVDSSLAACFVDQPSFQVAPQLQEGDSLNLKLYLGAEAKKEVISRDTDLMTADEQVKHKKEMDEAIVSEYKTWAKYNCFEMVDRKHAPLVIDSRMVLKWKYVDGVRTIRARMALRGFKEPIKDDEQTFAGTAQRISQRILASQAACNPDWIFGASDVPKAFLQGLTFKDISFLTGEPIKQIAFTIPKGTAQHLRCVPGYSGFDEHRHVLSCLKPGTGCRDAPRAFSMRLMSILKKHGLESTLYDPQLMTLFRNGTLVLVISIHVDDIKFAGEKVEVDKLIKILEAPFGKLTLQQNKFTNCGMTHERFPDGSIDMHQNEYIAAFKPIHPKYYQGYSPDAPCNEHQQALYMSLLGAVAYTSLTQPWILVYITALQRKNKQASISDIKKLNALTRELMRRPQKLHYCFMKEDKTLDVYSDSAFSREGDSAHSLKGMLCLRKGLNLKGEECLHLIEAVCQSHKLVVRSTYAAELLAATSAIDQTLGVAFTLHELVRGSLKTSEAKLIREKGGLAIKINLFLDAISVYHSITQENRKIPTEKSLLSHVAWLKETLLLGILSLIGWVDTRDQAADGLTKGKVGREAILQCMLGTFRRVLPAKVHHSKGSGAPISNLGTYD